MKFIIAIGTNIGDRENNIKKAIDAINNIPYTDVIRQSSIYETEPIGYKRQDDFYNCVVEVETQFDAHEMLGICLGIESGMGRERGIKNGPRILDLDIIFAENFKSNEPKLIVPHPRFHERRFVLEPLYELFPSGKVYENDFSGFLDKIDGQYVNKI